MAALTRQLRNTECDSLINQAILDKTMCVKAEDLLWAKRVYARMRRRRLDLRKFKIEPDPIPAIEKDLKKAWKARAKAKKK
jgi:hypothetical protein